MAIETKTARTLIAAGTVNSATAVTRAAISLLTASGGVLTYKITNGTPGPSAPCIAKVLIAHSATLPALAGAGADWKTVPITVNNGITAGAIGEWFWEIPRGVMHLEVEFSGNTVNPVTVEAYVSENTSFG